MLHQDSLSNSNIKMLNYVLDYIPYIILVLCLIYPFRTIIYNKFQAFFTKKNDIDIASAGGFIPFLRMLHAKQGKIVTSNLPYENTISVVDSEVMKATLHIGDRPIEIFKFAEPLLGEDNFQIYNAERALKLRKVLGPALGQEVLAIKYDSMRNVGIHFIKRWEEYLNSQNSVIIKMQEQCLEFALRATSKVLLSDETPQDFDFKKFRQYYDAMLIGLFDKQFGLIDNIHENDFQQSLDSYRIMLNKLINDRKNRNMKTENIEKPIHVKDFFDILITENDPDTGCPFSDEKIRSIISGNLTAGYHSTGVVIPYTLFALTQNPDVKAKLQNEIDDVLKGRLPTLEDLSQLDYLTQVVKESLRVYPPGTFFARLVKTDTVRPKTVENFQLQADNTTILYCIPLYHENPSYFVNPKKFDPSRFSRENIKNIKPNTYCPFGFGVRICPAERLAMVIIKMMVCLIVQKFDLELAMEIKDMQREEKFAVIAKNDILIKLTSRNGIKA
ncbi:cytochrome P450 [Gigaspora rosea]|uniref:Cytochrome P450 n=1 Tax=Gigaspora rosea TaxID=44941 RepID=A0A397V5M0_9GLOM|nr:cytochrome P450 [Gigaspora rosea]